MSCRNQSQHSSQSSPTRWGPLWAGALLALCLATAAGAASRAVVLKEGGSTVLQFQRMRRVAIPDPTVADVIVSSLNELLVYGKQAGHTKVYVWDSRGRHALAVVVVATQQAQQLAKQLRELLGPQFEYRVIDSATLLLDGQVADQDEQERISQIVVSMADQVEVINLIAVEGAGLSLAQRRAEGLAKLLGDNYNYLVWDDQTVLVMGQADSRTEAERVDKILGMVGDGVRISNLVTLGPGVVAPPVEEIALAVGPEYQVWALKGKTVVVEGEARDEVAKQRVDGVLTAFGDSTQIINLVTVSDEPKVPLAAQRDLLQAALGNGLQVRVIEGKALAVEGMVVDEDEAQQVKTLMGLFEDDTTIVDLTSVADPGKQQVLVHAKIVEVNRGALERTGVSWGQIVGQGLMDQPFLIQVEGGVDNVFDVGANIEALVTKDLAKVLSEPNLLVDDGETASMLVGGEVPIPVPQLAAGVATVTIEYKQYGVRLNVTPKILPGDKIQLTVEPEVSSIDVATQVSIGGINVPAFRTRKAHTTVTVDNGAALVIGGLIHREQSRAVTKIPILSEIPIIGELFKHKQFKEGKTELIIIVTPQIMQGGPQGVPGATEPEIGGG